MSDEPELPPDLDAYRDSYVKLFGTLPPLPRGKFSFTGAIDPDGLRLAEAFRKHAFENDVYDERTTQLIAFAVLIASASPAAKWHAISARKAGATWEELQAVVTIAAVVQGSIAGNMGGSLLDEVRQAEAGPA
jgi:alkylhydroperoxidase/carboxymuconolactone decarboxylase family protein YurZ